MLKRSFPRFFNVKYTWCVCRVRPFPVNFPLHLIFSCQIFFFGLFEVLRNRRNSAVFGMCLITECWIIPSSSDSCHKHYPVFSFVFEQSASMYRRYRLHLLFYARNLVIGTLDNELQMLHAWIFVIDAQGLLLGFASNVFVTNIMYQFYLWAR